jgi:hypothetical protein
MSNPAPKTSTRSPGRLACGCDVSGEYPCPDRCAEAKRLKAMSRATGGQADRQGHAYLVELARHLLRPENR